MEDKKDVHTNSNPAKPHQILSKKPITTTNHAQTSDDINLKPVFEKTTESVSPADEPHSIYTTNQKRAIILAASIAAFFSPLSANIYLPALNTLAKDLSVSNTLITLTVTTYLIFQGIAPTFVGAFSDSSGRRPAYLLCFIVYIGANVGLAIQRNYAALLVLRMLQSTGSSGTVAIANAVAADIVTSAERGSYIGFASVASILAPSLAPVIGGLLSQYAGWPWIFWFLVIFAVSFFVPFLILFPETCRKVVGNGSIPPPPLNQSLPNYLIERRQKKAGNMAAFQKRDELARKRRLRFPNPMDTLRIIFTKTAGLILLSNGLLFACYYLISASLPSQFAAHYGLSDLQISLIFLPLGVGSLLSALTTGFIVDWNYRRHAHRLGMPVEYNRQMDLSDFPIERVRLEIALPLLYVGAAAIIAYGWMVAEHVSIAGPCVALFIIGYAVVAGFNCMSILMVDMYPAKAATATAANNLVRCLLGAGASAFVIPMTDAIGVGWTCTLASAIWAGLSSPLIILLMRRGPKWRAETKAKKDAETKVRTNEGDQSKEIMDTSVNGNAEAKVTSKIGKE